MHSALLADGKVVTAKSYDADIHGVRIVCMDKGCRAPVIFIPETEDIVAHFKTSGKGNSIHNQNCGFARRLTFQETVSKVSEYQLSLREQGIREFLVRLNLNSIDPDYKAKITNNEPKDNEAKEKNELETDALKESAPTPQSIGSLKSVKKLFTTVEPDLLAAIIVTVQGKRIPISELIRHHNQAHNALWEDKTLDVPYFIHGRVDKVIRREKVWYINFITDIENSFFSLVIFNSHFQYFTYKDEELIGKEILAYGLLKKNNFHKDKKVTEMVIKSNKYIEFL